MALWDRIDKGGRVQYIYIQIIHIIHVMHIIHIIHINIS